MDTGRNGGSHKRDKPRGRTSARADRQKATGTKAQEGKENARQANRQETKGRGKERGKKSRKKHGGRRAGERHKCNAAMGALKATLEKDLGVDNVSKQDRRYKVMKQLIDRKLERWEKKG